jgi:hypothetical protein
VVARRDRLRRLRPRVDRAAGGRSVRRRRRPARGDRGTRREARKVRRRVVPGRVSRARRWSSVPRSMRLHRRLRRQPADGDGTGPRARAQRLAVGPVPGSRGVGVLAHAPAQALRVGRPVRRERRHREPAPCGRSCARSSRARPRRSGRTCARTHGGARAAPPRSASGRRASPTASAARWSIRRPGSRPRGSPAEGADEKVKLVPHEPKRRSCASSSSATPPAPSRSRRSRSGLAGRAAAALERAVGGPPADQPGVCRRRRLRSPLARRRGRILPAHPESTWIVTRDAHPAIVERGLFARVRRRSWPATRSGRRACGPIGS